MIKYIAWLFSLVGSLGMLAFIILTRHVFEGSVYETKPVRVRSDYHKR